MTAAPPLDTWPKVDQDNLTEEATILHELVRELGIPEIVLLEGDLALCGVHVPGDIRFIYEEDT